MEVILRSSLKDMSIFKATSCVHVPIFRRIQPESGIVPGKMTA